MVWFLILTLAVVLNASFQAGMTSNLSVDKATFPFTGLNDLYENTDYRVGGLSESSNEAVFKVRRVLLVLHT